MKISIDARGINLYKGTGIGTYTENLTRELLNIDKENDYTLFWNGKNYDSFKQSNSKIIFSSNRHGAFYENFYVPSYIEKNNIDLHHIPQNGIGLTESYSSKSIVTIHDLIPYTLPETVGRRYLENFLKEMPKILNKTRGILTVSEYSKRDILKFFHGYPAENIFVTPLAANSNFRPLDKNICLEFVKEKLNIKSPYILYIGGSSARKNVRELILAFQKINLSLKKPYTLVLGGSVKDEGKKLVSLVESLNLQNNIIFTGYLDDDILPILYNGAEAFVYPSLYEGFGLPPLEAMSCQTAVITSNLTSIPEVTSDAAILIDPFNSEELSSKLFKLLDDDDFRYELASKGYKRSLDFSWKKTAEKTLEAYNSLLY